MEKKEFFDNDNKYGNYGNFEVEQRALDKFELIKHKSSVNLRAAQRRIIIGFIIVFILSVLFGVFALSMSLRSTTDIQYLFEGPLSVRFYALKLNIDVIDVYRTMRDLALTDYEDQDQINKYLLKSDERIKQMNSNLDTLRDLAEHFPELSDSFGEMTVLLNEWEKILIDGRNFALQGDMEACRENVLGVGTLQVEKISTSVNNLVNEATALAQQSHQTALNRSKSFDFYSALLTLIIASACIIIIVQVKNHTSRAINMVDESQKEQNEILDELMIMDETLRQNLAQLEQESETVRDLQEKYSNSLEAANDVIWESNLTSKHFFASEKWEDITGFPKPSSFDKDLFASMVFEEDRKKFLGAFSEKNERFSAQFRIYRQDRSDNLRWLEIRGRWLDADRMTGSLSDITQKKEAEQVMEYMAYHDVITHLPNRAMFMHRLENALKYSEKNGDTGCVLFIDLDNFKLVNDSYGHDLGDKLLREVAIRLQSVMNEQTLLARFGGDEFLVLIENLADANEAVGIIRRVTESLADPVSIDGNLFYVTASIGASLFPEDGNDVNHLLKNSDAAMYESKSSGRGTFTFYNKNMSSKALRRSALSEILHNAIETGSVYLVYQPQYHSSKKCVFGCEALMRIKDPALGFISPLEFIPIAEETRLIIPLGYWAIRQAIETDLSLTKQGVNLTSMSVNVSEIQLRELDFVQQVQRIISDYDYDASRLHFEITESVLLNHADEKIKTFEKLRAIGIKIELDDFGTGYSSLNYARMIPLDAIKIDKCFTDEIGISTEKEGLIDLMVRLARMFNADVVAEGVETQDQVKFFEQIGDVILQGYYYSKPVESDELPAKIKELNDILETQTT